MSYVPKNQLLLSTTYNLNSSFTKQAVIGAELCKNGSLSARLKLISSHPQSNISLHSEEWKLLNSFFEEMKLFFHNEMNTQIINCQTLLLRFVVLNNQRLVSLERVPSNSLSPHPFTMNESTFLILSELSPCIEQHLEELSSSNLQNVKNVIVKIIGERL